MSTRAEVVKEGAKVRNYHVVIVLMQQKHFHSIVKPNVSRVSYISLGTSGSPITIGQC